jgi:hypothetical protein
VASHKENKVQFERKLFLRRNADITWTGVEKKL